MKEIMASVFFGILPYTREQILLYFSEFQNKLNKNRMTLTFGCKKRSEK